MSLSLLLAALIGNPTPPKTRTVWLGGFLVNVEDADGWHRVTVTSREDPRLRLTLPDEIRDRFFVSAHQWSLPVPLHKAAWITMECGSGSYQTLFLVAPRRGRLAVLLSAECCDGFNRPVETVDLRGDGVPDLITLASVGYLQPKPGDFRFDPWHSECLVWRWSTKTERYERIARTLYPYRLRPRV